MRKSLRLLLLAAALALAAFVLVDYVGTRATAPARLVETLPELPAEVAAQSRSWRWTQTTGGSTRIEVSAEDFEQGTDGSQTDLRGVVLRIFDEDGGSETRVESAAMRMLEGGTLFSDGRTVITLGIDGGGVSEAPAVAITSGVTFDPERSSAHTERLVRYEFRDGDGTSLGATYEAGSGILEMRSEVRMNRFGSEPAGPPTRVTAGRLRYGGEDVPVELSGSVRLEQGTRWLECERADVSLSDGRASRVVCFDARGGEADQFGRTRFLTQRLEARFDTRGALAGLSGRGRSQLVSSEDASEVEVSGDWIELTFGRGVSDGESVLRRVTAGGGAQARMDAWAENLRNTIESDVLVLRMRPGAQGIERMETLRRGKLQQVPLGETGPFRTLEAGRIRVRYSDGNLVEALSAEGRVRLDQPSGEEGGPPLRTWSDSLETAFEPGSAAIAGLHQAGSFRFEEGARTGRAQSARFDPATGVLELRGEASVAGEGSTVSADSVLLDRESGSSEARGTVTAVLAASGESEGGGVPAGLFGGQDAVYAAADSLVSVPGAARLDFRGGARLWQGRNRIDADWISMDASASALRAQGDVSVEWTDGEAAEGSTPDTATVRSDEMVYEEGSGEALFIGSVDLRRSGLRVLSDELRTAFGAMAEDLEQSAVATGSVRIADRAEGSGLRAFGDRAEFRFSASEVALAGEPARAVAVDGTETSGGSLTFSVAGDRLLVSGRGVERAYTVRPPSR